MKWVHIAGLTNPVSRIVLGGPFGERSDVESFCLLDRFLELGGTTIETAHSYANGAAEKQIGRWLRTREDRKSVVVITKVCHPREGQPSSMSDFDEEFDISQERLGVSSIDLLLLHRDPTMTPALQVLQTLEERRMKGTIRAYGISNIGGNRLMEFDRAAEALGVQGLALVSNYYGLARQACSPWPGALDLDLLTRRWLSERRRPLLCWSALAQGWFAHRKLPLEFRMVYDTATNRLRRSRVDQVASRMGASGIQVALAYTLSAPFDVAAVVGPRSLEELDSIVGALALCLSEQDYLFLRGKEEEE